MLLIMLGGIDLWVAAIIVVHYAARARAQPP
jgi:hypothetical protein